MKKGEGGKTPEKNETSTRDVVTGLAGKKLNKGKAKEGVNGIEDLLAMQ